MFLKRALVCVSLNFRASDGPIFRTFGCHGILTFLVFARVFLPVSSPSSRTAHTTLIQRRSPEMSFSLGSAGSVTLQPRMTTRSDPGFASRKRRDGIPYRDCPTRRSSFFPVGEGAETSEKEHKQTRNQDLRWYKMHAEVSMCGPRSNSWDIVKSQ